MVWKMVLIAKCFDILLTSWLSSKNPVKNSGHNVTAQCAHLPRAIPKFCAELYIGKDSFLVCPFVSNEIIQCPIYFDTKCIIVID